MFSRVLTGSVIGVDAYKIEVEVDCCGGIGQIQIVGLPDASVKESQERVRSAIKACDFILPYAKKWVVNLAPADTRKAGPAFDLPIAIGILASSSLMSLKNLFDLWFIGELGLDGAVRPVAGVLPVAMSCLASGAKGIIVPDGNADEASLVQGLKVYPVSHLRQAVKIVEDIKSGLQMEPRDRSEFEDAVSRMALAVDFRDVKGQRSARRALEIAAAGRHNVLLVGPPGAGKSMLAERLPGIMPPLSFDESLELTKLYSVAGLLSESSALVTQRPFRSPHHSSSVAGLVGGGRYPTPGEISLSHLGILFLDELTEFPRQHLDNLRQPLETARVTISRANQTLTYPASFLLVGACNPCPCGYRGDPVKYCVCTPSQADRYWSRLSGPLLDRIDMHIELKRLGEEELASKEAAESSEDIKLRVLRAVERQRVRNLTIRSQGLNGSNGNGKRKSGSIAGESNGFSYNGQLSNKQLGRYCQVGQDSRNFLARSVTQLGMSARAYDRILRLARTVADLDDSDEITTAHISESLRYRTLHRAV